MRYRLFLSLLTGLLLVGCDQNQPAARRGGGKSAMESGRVPGDEEGQSAGSLLDSADGKVRFGVLVLTPPQGWTRKAPQSSFVQGEFALPRAAGDETDGRLTLSVAGGSVEANIDRWKGQFKKLVSAPTQEQMDVAGMKITVVDMAGEYTDQRGPQAPAVTRADYRMIAAIIPIDGELHFIKVVGPQKTLEAHKTEIQVFIRSVKRHQ